MMETTRSADDGTHGRRGMDMCRLMPKLSDSKDKTQLSEHEKNFDGFWAPFSNNQVHVIAHTANKIKAHGVGERTYRVASMSWESNGAVIERHPSAVALDLPRDVEF